MNQPHKYDAKWIANQIGDRSWLPLPDCPVCGKDIGYVLIYNEVWFRSACVCGAGVNRLASFEEIADKLAADWITP